MIKMIHSILMIEKKQVIIYMKEIQELKMLLTSTGKENKLFRYN